MTISPRRHTEATAPTTRMTKVLFDFTDPNTADVWHAIDDRVMGGISRSELRSAPTGHAVFEGEVSLDRTAALPPFGPAPANEGFPALRRA